VKELSFDAGNSQAALTVKSEERWEITAIPEWLLVSNLENHGFSWVVSFSAAANTGYDRNGTLTFKSNTSSASVAVSQKGEKGATAPVTSVTLSPQSLELMAGETKELTAIVLPENASNKNVRWHSSSPTVARVSEDGLVTAILAGTATITVTTVEGGFTAQCAVTVSKITQGEENRHAWVDLGLSVKWATCNVGASSPSSYGDYYAWGETTPKNEYSWETYKWCNGTEESLTKYNDTNANGTVDNKTKLDLADDAARQNWGGKWRMPTKAELDELFTKCTCTWTTQNGKNGYLVTSKTNGNSIFMPAAGYLENKNTYTGVGLYWASIRYLLNNSPYAYCLAFDDEKIDWFGGKRFIGQSIRPVLE
jgi:hypothetical protein